MGQWFVKGWLYWVIFLILYFVYKFIPSTPLKVICAICESNFQHYKASFFSWIILSLGEFLWVRRRIQDRQAFLYSRMATATIPAMVCFNSVVPGCGNIPADCLR